MEQPGFWDDVAKSTSVSRQLKELQDSLEEYQKLEQDFSDIETLIQMAEEEGDSSMIEEIGEMLTAFQKEFENYRISLLLSDEFDGYDAVMTLHAGAGGTESCDWTSMLYRMYTRWAEKHGFKVEVLDYLEGDEAGIKSVTMQISGQNAYGYLKSEKGVHRLVRISPFNAAGKRQTSFASCDVIPEIEEDLEVDINEDDLRIDTYRSSGAGGQHINKTSSAIRITHLPTGMVVECQDERSQFKNKEKALKVLRSRLLDQKVQAQNKEIADNRRSQVGTGDRSERIRTYNYPEGRISDHRIGLTIYRLEQVLNGALDEIIDALATADQAAKLASQEEE